MSIHHDKLLALCDVPGMPDQWDATDGYMHGWNDCLRALAQPAEAPHCKGHAYFDDGCIDCSDALERQRKGQPAEAVPNDDAGAGAVVRHGLMIYEVDFGDEGKGRYIRLRDFNAVVRKLEQRSETADCGTDWPVIMTTASGREYVLRRDAECRIKDALALSADNARTTDAAQGAVAVIEKAGDRYGSYLTHCDVTLRLYDGFVPAIGSQFYPRPQAAPAQGGSLRHTNAHLTKSNVERNVRSSSALEGISTQTFQAAADGDKE